jgi:protein-serine/threonine kinase
MENSNPRDRLYLNFGNNDPKFQPDTRTYPTTPSTFPNPIFQNQGQGGQQPHSQNGQQPYSTGFAPAGYFMNNPYPPTYPQQPPSSYQQGPQAPQASYQQRSAVPNNDATNGLVHQFSHQNLGGASRPSPYGSRQPSPSQRPRTAGATGQQPGYGSYLNAPMPSQSSQQQNRPEFQSAPERNSEKYTTATQNNQTKCRALAEAFFKDSVKRARDRNLRLVVSACS